ncbi:kinesin-like protein KIF20B [Pundamilia nyererei]|uniref:Kinesin-like protein KIF20B n=1 Tax=Pundamilia nyererei TaxID=303518 RepID=A0A9Y3VPK2_9CICH|nr:PREDICTED: kinesin-like protein KIF20B [Pundamilia nyererei]
MDSSLAGRPERVGPVEVGDIKKDLLAEFSAMPTQDDAQEQSENLQVYLRVRPFTAAESGSREAQDCVTIEGPDTVVLKPPRSCQSNRQSDKSLPQTAQRFTFTQVFGPEASQRKVFEGSVRGLVRDVLQGGNCLVFTYGVTNAGKTFTFLGPDHDSGLLPRSLSVIFNSIEGRLYGRCDLKPQRCRDFSRLTPDQQATESSSKRNLLRMLKESDRSATTGRSAFLEGDVQVPGGQQRRTVLRLSQDVKGNSFIKDLRWVQVSSSEEAYRVMKIGKRNQSFSSTRLNQLSSRSHSIFSIRILRVDDVGVPRVLGISELALCDLAGSERCSRTHNTGERLKEAGNINSSLLTLGKCIHAMRLNQNAKFQHHIPFRESKLTHFLQFFFCGAGRVSMVVNINQNSSCFDETLNVLKFSALAQKVVVLNSRPTVPDCPGSSQRSAMELSLIIDEADCRRNVAGRGRKSSLLAWETSLEDVLEDEDGEEGEEDGEEESMMEGTVLEAGGENEEEWDVTMEEDEKQEGREAALRLVLEAQVREEVSAEFMELFKKMEKDYSDRLEKEREILEERAEKRVEILKNLVSKTVDLSALSTDSNKEEQVVLLEGIISSMSQDLEKIREDAQSVHRCLTEHTHSTELEALRLDSQQSRDQLQEAEKRLEQQQQEVSKLMELCRQKDGALSRLRAAMDDAVEDATRDKQLVESIRSQLLELQQTCGCTRRGQEEEGSRKHQPDPVEDEKQRGANRRVVLEEEIWRLQEENDRKNEAIVGLRGREEELQQEKARLEEELRSRVAEVEGLKKEQVLLEEQLLALKNLDECPNCDTVLVSLEAEQREASRLQKENKALVNGIFQLQTEVTSLQVQLKQQTDRSDSLSEQFKATKTRLHDLEHQSEEKNNSISSLTQELERLRQEVKEEEGQSSSVFHAAMEELKKESEAALQRSAQKSQQIEELQTDKWRLEAELTLSENRCAELREELANQRAEFSHQLESLRAELDSEGDALQAAFQDSEERRRQREMEVGELQRVLDEKEKGLEESRQQVETLSRELQRREEEENRAMEEEALPLVEELKKEIQKLQERRQEEEDGGGKKMKSGECEAVMKQRDTQDLRDSPLRSNMAARKKTPRTTGRKRKSCELEVLVHSENKRNKPRGNARCVQERGCTLQKIEEAIHTSPCVLGSKGSSGPAAPERTHRPVLSADKNISSVEKEAVTVATKPRRGRRKLYNMDPWAPMVDSPHTTPGAAAEDRESDHSIMKRKLRSQTCRK